MNTAGAAAQRWGWSVKRYERPSSVAQPIAKPHRTAPVMAVSVTDVNGAKTRMSAARTPVANEADTSHPRRSRGLGRPSGGAAGTVGVAVGGSAGAWRLAREESHGVPLCFGVVASAASYLPTPASV